MSKPKPLEERRNIHICLETTNFMWDEDRLPDLRFLWSEGYDVLTMSKYFRRPVIDIVVAILDQGELGLLHNLPYDTLSESFKGGK